MSLADEIPFQAVTSFPRVSGDEPIPMYEVCVRV